MESTPQNSTTTRRADRILIFLFVLFLWLPTLDTVFHFDSAPIPSENRLPAQFPEWRDGPAGLKKFLAGLDAFFSDHFGCRKCLIQWQNKIRNNFFHEKDSRHALVGGDGWLFLSDAQMAEHFRGTLQFTPAQLADWQRLLEKRRDWLAQRGIRFLFVVAPDKQSIYPEPLPDWLNKLGGRTKLDQFVDFMLGHSTVQIVDLRPALRAARQTRPVYLKTDTHWNQFGAFSSCQELVRTLSPQLSDLRPLALDDFDFTNRPAPAGDLAAFVGVSRAEDNAFFFTPKTSLPPVETTSEGSPLKPATHVTRTANPAATRCAVVYHDSFGVYWIPFLGHSFGHVTYHANNHLESDCFDSVGVEKEKPDVVICELVERYFNEVQPRKLLAGDRP